MGRHQIQIPQMTFFLRTDQKNKGGLNTIYLRYVLNEEKIDKSTKIRIAPADWNEKKLQIRASHVGVAAFIGTKYKA